MIVDEPPIVDVIKKAVEDSGYDCELVNPRPPCPSNTSSIGPSRTRIAAGTVQTRITETFGAGGSIQSDLFVDGMTCASCVSNVMHAVEEISGVTQVAVNLLGKSASATLQSEDLALTFISAIEDAGYDIELVNIEQEAPRQTGTTLNYESRRYSAKKGQFTPRSL